MWETSLTHGWQLGGDSAVLFAASVQRYDRDEHEAGDDATALRSGIQFDGDIGGLNPCTEALPGAVIGRNAGIGFDFFSLNARLSRTFAVTERVKVEGIAEAFNALNHRNDMIPNGTWGTGSLSRAPNASFRAGYRCGRCSECAVGGAD